MLLDALRLKYDPQAFAFLTEVRRATGYNHTPRYADAVAMSLWPSRGLLLNGFELKASRKDWKKELDHPEKADESIFPFCDRWWLVVADEEIVDKGELPATWGLMAPKGKSLAVKVEAPTLKPKPVDRGFLASLLRAAVGQLPAEAELERVRHAAHAEGVKAGQQYAGHELEALRKTVKDFEGTTGLKLGSDRWGRGPHSAELGKAVKGVLDEDLLGLRDRVQKFEKASGLSIDDWRIGDMGEAVKILTGNYGDGVNVVALLNRIERPLRNVLQELEAVKGSAAKATAP